MKYYICCLCISFAMFNIASAQTSTADGPWGSNATWAPASSPGFTGLGTPIVNSYVTVGSDAANQSLTFANDNGRSLTVNDTLIVFGDVTFNITKNNAAVSIGAGKVLIIFGDLEMGKNNAGVDIGAGGILVVMGNITADGNNGVITGPGSVFTSGTSNMAGNNTGESGDLTALENSSQFEEVANYVNGDQDVPLPVKLLYFRAEVSSGVVLQWATASEIDNDYFAIERSENGIDYYQIATLVGNGTYDGLLEYEYVDKKPQAAVEYYRLKQVDFDGVSETFQPIRVEASGVLPEHKISLYPSVVGNGQLNITSDQPLYIHDLTVYSMKGGALMSVGHAEQNTMNTYLLDVNQLTSGVYILRLQTSEGDTYTNRFVVK
ncbi:MAG: T9SS type A sorting domain-containing protein [Marinoscillum sp.]|uniref:T9SS type A sorting domain-containing protein n=1 Tax=Marinoscillum sp. TaxID=2024838 RepID=UPI0032F93191